MNDRELLELAAKAAGVEGGWGERVMIGGYEVDLTDIWFLDSPDTCAIWNPLEDDGDALRLAMKLGFTVEPGRCWHSPYGPAFGEDVSVGEMTATRRAIVRAAAAIGEAML